MITTKQLHDMWGEGKNSFKTDPLNAVLSASGLDERIVILHSMTTDNGQLTYTLVLKDDLVDTSLKGGAFKDLVITIDG